MTIDEINIPQASCSEFQLTCKNTGLSYELENEVLIGRELDCTIRLAAPQIRRYHAKVSRSDDGLFLEDLNAKNNTYLNGSRIGTGAWITLGDEINFDGVRFSIDAKQQTPNTSFAEPPVDTEPKEQEVNPIDSAMPFSNQDVVEATRALEERAKARLQMFKTTEDSGVNPDWENFIANRNKDKKKEQGPSSPAEAATQEENLTNLPDTPRPAAIEASVIPPEQTRTESTPEDSESASHIDSAGLPAAKQGNPEINQTETAESTSDQPKIDTTKSAELDLGAANDSLNSEEQAELLDLIENLDEAPTTQTRRAKPALNLGSGPRLVVQTAPTRGKIYQLAATDSKTSWTIGRSDSADIQVNEETIDRIHAHIEQSNEQFKIRTTRTTNGMLINDRFKGEATLKQGDIVQFGRMSLEFREDTGSATEEIETSKHRFNWGNTISFLVILGALLAALLVGK